MTGLFRSDTVAGLGYASGTHSGLTDKSGAFRYEEGQGIAFSVGQIVIGVVPTAKTLMTPVDLVAQGTGESNRVPNVVRFLMMLDQDLNVNNGIQISTAVASAAANWAPVDFDTTDLPTTLAALIQQASAADGVAHALPDAATAQAHLRTGFYCTHAGDYYGTFGKDSMPGTRGDFVASVFPDGSMHSVGYATDTLTGFNVSSDGAVSPSLDGTVAQIRPSGELLGGFGDATYLSASYKVARAANAGSFQAVGDASVTATYKFSGSFTWTPTTGSPYSGTVNLGMDDANQVSGSAVGPLTGTVTGTFP